MSRCFIVTKSSVGKVGGAYHSDSPASAAKKAGRQQFVFATRGHKSGKASPCKKASPRAHAPIKFTLVEHFGGRKYADAGHSYSTTRVAKKKPSEFTVGGRTFVSLYDYSTRATH